jgi:hypothetical protein
MNETNTSRAETIMERKKEKDPAVLKFSFTIATFICKLTKFPSPSLNYPIHSSPVAISFVNQPFNIKKNKLFPGETGLFEFVFRGNKSLFRSKSEFQFA